MGPSIILSPSSSHRQLSTIRYASTTAEPTSGDQPGSPSTPRERQQHEAPASLYRVAGKFEHLGIKQPRTADEPTEAAISKLRETLSPILKSKPNWKVPNNHNRKDLESLREATVNLNEVTVIPTDKTNRFCTLPTSACEDRLRQHLSNGWIELSEDPSTSYQHAANEILKESLNEAGIHDGYLQTRLSTRHATAPIIYPLAKDHKPDFPNTKVRVVQPIAGSAVEKLDVIVASVLSQLLPLLRYRVDSSKTFISQCLAPWIEGENTPQLLGPEHVIVSMDIESMYPSLPTNNIATDYIRCYLEEHRGNIDLLGFKPRHITNMMQFITTHTYARACGKHYLQTTGVGTGYHSSGAYAEILVDFTYKRALLNMEDDSRPLYLGTYVDDSNSLWKSIEDARTFLSHLNNVWDGELRFTMEEPSHRRISFLDILIAITDEGKIQHQLYQKETHSGMYLPFNSHCETKTKLNIVTTEARRILGLCSSKDLAWPHLETLRGVCVRSSGHRPQIHPEDSLRKRGPHKKDPDNNSQVRHPYTSCHN